MDTWMEVFKMEHIRVGVIGCGGIANSVHLPQLDKATGAIITALCDTNEKALEKTGDLYHVPEANRFSDYHDLINSKDVDAVDICTPNNSHCPIAHAAIRAQKPFCVEKPVGITYKEARDLEQAAEHAGIPAMVCFSYRFRPAVRYAWKLMQEGKIGNIVHVYAQYLKASAFMSGRRLDWRFTKEAARYGVSGDLAVHIIDMIQFLVSDFKGVFSQTGIVIKKRQLLDSDEWGPVETDDYCNFLAELDGDIPANFGISRSAIGNKNRICVDLYGDRGALRFDLTRTNEIQVCFDDGSGADQKMETITLPDTDDPNQMQTFINRINGETSPFFPTLADGAKSQKILDALLSSSENQKWMDL